MNDNFFEDEYILGASKLTEKLVLGDLIKNGSAEFTLEAPEREFDDDESCVENVYDFDAYKDLTNLDCVNIDSSENADATPFSELEVNMINVTEDGGVKKMVKQEGIGSKVPENAFVYVHYSAYKEMEEVPFDSSYLRSQKPVRYQLGVGAIYLGFELALLSMKENEKSQFLIKPEYAFGKLGIPPRIPPEATLLLDIHLISSVDYGATLEQNDVAKKSFEVAFKKAKSYHLIANDYFKQKNISTAIENYKKAEHILLNCSLLNDQEEKDQKHLLLKIYTNLCICYNSDRMKSPERACIAAREATRLDPELARKNCKLQFGWGKALVTLCEYKEATRHFKMALSVEPNNATITKELKELAEKKKSYLNYEQITYSKALGFKNKPKKEESSLEDTEYLKTKESLKSQLKAFVESKSSRLQLPEGLVKEEKEIIKSLCEEMELRYHEQSIGENTRISILK